MSKAQTFVRGWLAVTFVQQIGLILQHLRDPKILEKNFSTGKTPDPLAGHLFLLLCFNQALLKGFLLIDNSNRSLHFFHIANNFSQLIFLAWSTFYEQAMFSIELLSQSAFAAISIILTVIFLVHLPTEMNFVPQKERKPRKLFSKHFLESQISDYDPQKRKNE